MIEEDAKEPRVVDSNSLNDVAVARAKKAERMARFNGGDISGVNRPEDKNLPEYGAFEASDYEDDSPA